MNAAETYRCPNCGSSLSGTAASCPKCKASFEGPNAWKPLRDAIARASALAEDPTLKGLRILGYVSLVFWPALLLAAGMAFDAPSATRHVLPYVVVSISLAYGLLPFVIPAAARAVLRSGHRRAAIAIAAFPFSIVPLLTALNLFFYFIAMALRRQ
jgi:hypothetical protein